MLSHCRSQARVETASNPRGDAGCRGKGLCIIRKSSGFEVTRARSLFGDVNSAVFGVTEPSAGIGRGAQATSGTG